MDNVKKILVVDDDEALRTTLCEILEDEGFDVSTANNGVEAVELASQDHFALIFMDVRMPEMDGVEAFRRIRTVDPETIVILVTAYADQALLEDALGQGAYAVLYKPIEPAQLTGAVRSVLKSTCVLVVDDQAESREMVRSILEDAGFDVSEAESGSQAVSLANEKQYDVILMDAVMPGMDGVTACQEIIDGDPNAKVVFLTAYSVVNWVKQALSAGALSVLNKPVEPEHMISVMKSVTNSDEAETDRSK